MSLLLVLVQWLSLGATEPSPCLTGELAQGYGAHLRQILQWAEPHMLKAYGLEGAPIDSVSLNEDPKLCRRARDAYNRGRTEPWQNTSAIVGVFWIGPTRLVVVDGQHPGEHYRDWVVYDRNFRELGGFVS